MSGLLHHESAVGVSAQHCLQGTHYYRGPEKRVQTNGTASERSIFHAGQRLEAEEMMKRSNIVG